MTDISLLAMQQAPCTAPGEAASAIVFNAFRARTLVETKSVHLGLDGLMSETVLCLKLVTTMTTLANCTVRMTTSGKTAGDLVLSSSLQSFPLLFTPLTGQQ